MPILTITSAKLHGIAAAVLTALNSAAFAAPGGSPKTTTVHVRADRKRRRSGGVTKRKAYSADRIKRIAK